MKRKKLKLGVLMLVTALIIMQLPVSEADAAASASDFKIEGSTLVKYRGKEKNVSVPKTVTSIGRGAFEDNMNVELVVLPNSVTDIGPYAFWGCDNLDTVVLGKDISAVGDYAFAGCKGLEQMTIPSSVSTIGVQAFADCVNLKDISIPAQTTVIHETAFDGCVRLTIHCDKGSAADEYAQSFYERQKEMPEYEDVPDYDPSNPVAPEEPGTQTPEPSPSPAPTEVPPEPGSVLGSTHIVGNRAVVFADNSQLQVHTGTSEKNPASLSGEDVFGPAQGGSLPKFAIVDGSIVADQAYYRSGKLGSVTLPEGIVEIGQFAFARSSLTDILIPPGTEHIGYGAFYHCDYLEQVTIPDTVMCVEPKAFAHSLWVENFLRDSEGESDFLIEGGVLAAYRGNAAEVTVPKGVRVIAGEAFQNHKEIESLTLPDDIVVVGEGAFEGCSGLSQITLGKNIKEIKDRAFKGTALTEVSLPSLVEKLGLQAFGSALITYEGGEAEYTYETSASRLSNEEYRVYSRTDAQESGVEVSGAEGAYASLEGANRGYILTVAEAGNKEAMDAAFRRSFRIEAPADMTLYDLTLTDDSGIPLTKLGSQTLTVVLPVPDALKGQGIKLFTLDRNGQLEALSVERVSVEGTESIRFSIGYVSSIGILGMGAAAEDGELLEIGVELDSLSAAPQEADFSQGSLGLLIGVLLAGTGLTLICMDILRRRRS